MKYLNSFSSKIQYPHKGFILIFSVVIISITVGLSVSMLITATRQSQLGSLQSETQSAFYAADTAIECGLAQVYPVIPPGSFRCAGMTPVDKNGDPNKAVYYFDYRSAMPGSGTPVGWAGGISIQNWSDISYGGDTSSCGVVVITYGDTWTQLVNGITKTFNGDTIEGYGYNVCVPDAADNNALKPATQDPALVERKLLVRVPVTTT